MRILTYLFNLLLINSQMLSDNCINCMNRQIMGENIDCFDVCNEESYINDCSSYTFCDNNKHLIIQDDKCYCENYIDCYEYLCTSITEINTESKLIAYTTYELALLLKDDAKNIYALYGDIINPMFIPEAFQVNQIAGTNIGGINNILLKRIDESKYDSWLSIGITDGDIMGRISTIGIDYSTWDIFNPLIVDDGAIFVEAPIYSLSDTNKYVIAHLTLSDMKSHQITLNVQGKTDLSLEDVRDSTIDSNFRVTSVTFNINKKNNIRDSH